MTQLENGYEVKDDEVKWTKPLGELLGSELFVIFSATEVRRERTGLHAKVAIALQAGENTRPLSRDTFNLDRGEDIRRLAKGAWAQMLLPVQKVYLLREITDHLDSFCREVSLRWEDRFTIDFYDFEQPDPIEFALEPYVPSSGGVILFAPPGAGKSFIAIIKATIIATGHPYESQAPLIWRVPKRRRVLYVNLERSATSMKRRSNMVLAALGYEGLSNPVAFLNARGKRFVDVRKKVVAFVQDSPDAVVFIDSLSRMGIGGSMTADDVANSAADLLNSTCPCWYALGHTPRNDATHVFGSTMYDAAEDVGIMLASEEQPDTLGISLKIVKANDIPKTQPEYLRLSFSSGSLISISHAKPTDFPELLASLKTSNLQTIIDYLKTVGVSCPTEIADNTGVDKSNVAKLLKNAQLFKFEDKHDRKTFYSLRLSLQG